MAGAHARLSPSDAARWISCPAAIALDEAQPGHGSDDGDDYAAEGTCAHALAEIKASVRFGLRTERQGITARVRWMHEWEQFTKDPETVLAMDEHTDSYVILLERLFREMGPGTHVALEQRLQTSITGSWGTTDALLSNPFTICCVDFKYGAGVPVLVEGNEQLMLYADGGLRKMDIVGTVERIIMVVHQPRINNYVGMAEMTADELRAWTDTVRPIAAEALAGSDRFGPSDKACRWCQHSGQCAAQTAWIFDDGWEGTDTRLLSPEQISTYLDKVDSIKNWLEDFEATALDKAYSQGVKIPGYKVVRSGGSRKIHDPEGARTRLLAEGYQEDEIMNTPDPKIKGIGDLESLLGKPQFSTLMAPFVHKPPGREALASEDDPRPAINPNTEAAADFALPDEDIL